MIELQEVECNMTCDYDGQFPALFRPNFPFHFFPDEKTMSNRGLRDIYFTRKFLLDPVFIILSLYVQ